MNLQFKNTDGGITPALQERIERKLAKLSRLTDTPEHSANAFFELERSVGSHQTGNVWQASLTIDANGERFYTTELAESPEKASQKVLKEIRTKLRRAKGKKEALIRRGGGIFKSITQRLTRV